MRFVMYDGGHLGLLSGERVVPLDERLPGDPAAGQQRLVALIEASADPSFRDGLEELETSPSEGLPLASLALEAPVPQPVQLLCAIKNYADDRTGVQADFFLKSPLSISGPTSEVVLPEDLARVFHYEPEVAVVISKPHGAGDATDPMSHVFGYTGIVDMSARDLGSSYYYKKSFRSFAPMGPVIVTADEVGDPYKLRVVFSVDGEVRQDFLTVQMANRIDRLIEVASHVSGLATGDVIATGTYHIGMSKAIDGAQAVASFSHGIGDIQLTVRDPLARTFA